MRAILANPRYTGRQVWNRQRRDQVLVDVHDVALGHQSVMRWNDENAWVWSAELAHEPLVSTETFEAAARLRAAGVRGPTEAKRRTTARRYVLSGLVSCGLCGRRMQGQPNHGHTYYRCRFPAEYALAAAVDHPKTVYVQEAPIITALDGWLGRLFDPEHLDATCRALAAASEADEATLAQLDAARRQFADCDARLARYRAALDAGADPAVVAGWTRDVQARRLAADRAFAEASNCGVLTAEDVRAAVGDARKLIRKLANADADVKAQLYQALGVRLTYLPDLHKIELVAQPIACATARVGGGT